MAPSVAQLESAVVDPIQAAKEAIKTNEVKVEEVKADKVCFTSSKAICFIYLLFYVCVRLFDCTGPLLPFLPSSLRR